MRYAKVVPDIPTRAIDGCFDYAIPDALAGSCNVGCTVLVSFAHRLAVGYVVDVVSELAEGVNPLRVLPVERVLAEPAFDRVGARLAQWMAAEYAAPASVCLRLMLAPGQTTRVHKDEAGEWRLAVNRTKAVDDRWAQLSVTGRGFVPRRNASRQRRVVEALAAGPMRVAELSAMVPGAGSVVTALAKRGLVEVEHRRRIRGVGEPTSLSSASAPRPDHLTDGQLAALDAIERVRERGRSAIVLVPEISLTAQTVGRFRSRFGDDVAILHSRLSSGERFDQWDLARSGRVHVVVGARSALFAPLSNVGLVIVDEEHEGSYKQDQAPRYHAREAAAELARLRGAALVLGSATPSLESLERCRAGSWRGVRWTRVSMPERPGGSRLPSVRIIDMRSTFSPKGGSVFSSPLRDALLDRAEKREKSVLLLNRRGFASFLMCRECGCVPTCPHCSTALTYHERTHSLACHTCGSAWPVRAYPDPSTKCPNCGSRYLAQYGVGTQRVEDELRMLLPEDVDVIRMDADTTATKGAHTRLLEQFDASECAVLVGTQMIAKGLDFPEVTLVGVVNADTTLKLPDFRAAERTYNLLEQVAGRAGRGERPGEVIIQTYWATHPAISAVATHDRSSYLGYELEQRDEAYYPPYSRLANLTLAGLSERAVRERASALAAKIRARVEGMEGEWEVLGPAECVRSKVKDRYRRHIVVKAPVDAELGPLLDECARALPACKGVTLAIDVDAYDML